jgi:hypothetical protein
VIQMATTGWKIAERAGADLHLDGLLRDLGAPRDFVCPPALRDFVCPPRCAISLPRALRTPGALPAHGVG